MEYLHWLVPLAIVVVAIPVSFGIDWLRQRRYSAKRWMPNIMRRHFRTREPEMLLVAERQFPYHMRVELVQALNQLFTGETRLKECLGIKRDYAFVEVSFGELIDFESRLFAIAPQYEEVNVGEEEPVRVVRNGVWLGERGRMRFALVLTQDRNQCGGGFVRVQVTTPNDAQGTEFSRELFHRCEQAIAEGRYYRGKILSFEAADMYTGETSGITIHHLRTVDREQVILPRETLELVERNVIQFAQQRVQFARFGQSTKKGLLLYGPPGTGKTHTIHYLAKAVPGQTVFLISAEQVKNLTDYMTLARLLQPSLVVIEDVDLIARDRREIADPASEALLNRLLNEMDGLKEDARIVFLLTTNRPEVLEAALAARPGRIDQAVEFALPDDECRERLVQLYAARITVDRETVARIVQATDGVSGAFIKELIRRSIQYCLARAGDERLEIDDIDQALDEMLRGGGVLNRNLLGAGKVGYHEALHRIRLQ